MNKKRFLTALTCIIAGGCMLHAQDLLVLYPSNSGDAPWETSLSEIGKVSFSDTGLAFVGRQGQTLCTQAYRDVNRIELSLTGVGMADNKAVLDLFVYPNPVVDYLNMAGWDAEEKADIAIYSITGQPFHAQKEWRGAPIPVSSLPQGLYILKVNDRSFKFRKL